MIYNIVNSIFMDKKNLKKRWSNDEIKPFYQKLKKKIRKQFIACSPFGKIEGYEDFRGFFIEEEQNLKNVMFVNAQFQYSNLASIKLYSSHFKECIFKDINANRLTDHGNKFVNCTFEDVDFTKSILGYDGSKYEKCVFKNCDLSTADFIKAQFDYCIFDESKLNGVDFNVSSFIECEFRGELDDVWFRGDYALPSSKRHFGEFRKNTMEGVDFRGCKLSWLTFTGNVPLNNVLLPKDDFVFYLDNLQERFKSALSNCDCMFNDYKYKNIACEYLQDKLESDFEDQDETIMTLSDLKKIYDVNDDFLVTLKSLLLAPE